MTLPLQHDPDFISSIDASLFNISQIEALPVTYQEIQQATRNDPVLSKVLQFVKRGWPNKVPEVLKPFSSRANELTVEENCVLWRIRVIILKKLRHHLLLDVIISYEVLLGVLCGGLEKLRIWLHSLSVCQEKSICCSSPPMDLAFKALGTCAPGLCRPLHGENVSYIS